jgi:flagellar biosynthesis/type III secretory pathway protein FliH
MQISKYIFESFLDNDKKTSEVTNEEVKPIVVDEQAANDQTASDQIATFSITYNQEELDKKKSEGYAEGYSKAKEELKQQEENINANITQVLSKIEQNLVTLIDKQKESDNEIIKSMTELSLAIAKKMIETVPATEKEAELEKSIKKILELIRNEQELTIYIHPLHEKNLEAKIKELQQKSNFNGKITLKAGNDINEYDCRVEWQNGIIESSKEKIWHEIEQTLGVKLSQNIQVEA